MTDACLVLTYPPDIRPHKHKLKINPLTARIQLNIYLINCSMDQLLKVLKALADETRLRMTHILLTLDLCGRALARQLGISEAAVSQHMKIRQIPRAPSLWIAFWNILVKDVKTYYLKPPNIRWGIMFPLAWTAMFFIKSGSGWESVPSLLPGVMSISILFGTTSMLAVTVTFEKKGRSFDRLLLAPLPLEILMLAKTAGAIVFGMANAFVPVILALFLTDLSHVAWGAVFPSLALIAISSTFLGLFIAVSVSEIFEAQTFSNFFVSLWSSFVVCSFPSKGCPLYCARCHTSFR